MAITGGEYGKMAKKASPPTNKIKNGFLAFVIGGFVCALGEGAGMLYEKLEESLKKQLKLASLRLKKTKQEELHFIL